MPFTYIDIFLIKISKLIYQYLSYGASHKTSRRMSKGVSIFFLIVLRDWLFQWYISFIEFNPFEVI